MGRVLAQVSTVIPTVGSTYAYTVTSLVQYGTNGLIGCVRTYAHPSTIRAVGRRCIGSIMSLKSKALDGSPFVQVVHRFLNGCTTAVVSIFGRCAFIPCTHAAALRQCHNFHRLSIAYSIGIGDTIGTHIIDRCWLHVLDVEDHAFLAIVEGRTVVGNGRLWLSAPAEAALLIATTRERSTQQGSMGSRYIESSISRNRRCIARAIGHKEQ